MEEMPPTSPHFVGLWVALVGMAIVVVVATRPRIRERFGRRGRVVASVVLVLLAAVGFFGNGVHGTSMRGLLTPFIATRLPLDSDRVGRATEEAVDVTLSEDFIDYHAELRGLGEPAFDGEFLRERLELDRATYGELERRGEATISPPPPRDTRLHVYRYYDAQPYAFHVLGVNRSAHDQAFRYLQRTLNDIDELVLLEAYRLARGPDERLAVLEALHSAGVPYHAEWVARALRQFRAAGPSDDVARKLDDVLAWTAVYVEDPTMRALPADTSVDL